ncbi:MAG: hypothetical protein ACU0DT_17750 [Albimonas sp.]|uniref:hypothetical protein n=1 Tax=Albimonas sp. TaxID=1872425 RepID=UPI0040566427
MYYDLSSAPCPKCGGETHQDSVDVGVGIIHGPRGCIECGWSEAPEYDLSDGQDPLDERGGARDQFGGYHPPGSATAAAYRMAEAARRRATKGGEG